MQENDFSKNSSTNDFYKTDIDLELFNKYVKYHQAEYGIELKRVLYGIIAQK